jgi:hypothetical protein
VFRLKHDKRQDGRCCVRCGSYFFAIQVLHEECDHSETGNPKCPNPLGPFCWSYVEMIDHKLLLNLVEMKMIAHRDRLIIGSVSLDMRLDIVYKR